MRLGIIGSSGGSALKTTAEIYTKANEPLELIILADRVCGLSEWARQAGHEVFLHDYRSAGEFSEWADSKLELFHCADVLLFYTRRVSSPLIDNRSVSNIHPALLPSFKGLRGVGDAMAAGVTLFGATLHQVDANLDTGPISAQICSPMPRLGGKARADRISYIHKVWLTLLWLEGIAGRLTEEPTIQVWERGMFLASNGMQAQELTRAFEQWLATADLDT